MRGRPPNKERDCFGRGNGDNGGWGSEVGYFGFIVAVLCGVWYNGVSRIGLGGSMFIERDCTFEHESRKFESGGAMVTDNRCVVYLKKGGIVTTWKGERLGTYRVVSSWKVHSWIGERMYAVRILIDGVEYWGRGFGNGMVCFGKRVKG